MVWFTPFEDILLMGAVALLTVYLYYKHTIRLTVERQNRLRETAKRNLQLAMLNAYISGRGRLD